MVKLKNKSIYKLIVLSETIRNLDLEEAQTFLDQINQELKKKLAEILQDSEKLGLYFKFQTEDYTRYYKRLSNKNGLSKFEVIDVKTKNNSLSMRKITTNRYIVGLHSDGVYIKSSVSSKRLSNQTVLKLEKIPEDVYIQIQNQYRKIYDLFSLQD